MAAKKKSKKKMTPVTLTQPIIGNLLNTITYPSSNTTCRIYSYYGSHNGWQTVHRHHNPNNQPGQQNWDTLAPQDWDSDDRAEYNATIDAIVTARYYY